MKKNKPIKVVWLCHFSNEEVQKMIKPSKKINEMAPWIPSSIRILENIENIELHIISPHEYITGLKKYKKEGVYYYFYNAHMPFTGGHWPCFFKWDYISNFKKNKKNVKKIVDKVKPDIIHLHGAENAYFSSTILQFLNKYPTVFTLQGFISNSNNKKSKQIRKRIEVEEEILKNIRYAFYRTNTMKDHMRSFNSNLEFFWNDYPYVEVKPIVNTEKTFDIVFFARITRDKGIGDLIKALGIIKQKKKNVSLCVIGGGAIEPWKKLAAELDVNDNIYWAGFLPTQNDVHKMASKAKISVLPTYHDIISGTILESLFLKLPVVAYNVGSIHEVNEKEDIIRLVERLDVEGLAKAIDFLLGNPEVQKQIAEKGYKRVREMFVHSDEEIRESLLKAYSEVVKKFKERK